MSHNYNANFENIFSGLVELKRYSWQKDVFNEYVNFCYRNFDHSKSQLFQDLFVLFVLNSKKNGFFVEFGATNGFDLSNTFLLEKAFDWSGILAEPAKSWHPDLKKNRGANIDTRCVWNKSGSIVEFNEVAERELSTINEYSASDHYEEFRKNSTLYNVETITLNDLLVTHKAPNVIDYISIDTEGTELTILEAFDFEKFNVSIFTIEHNFTENRQAIFDLMTKNNFKRVFENISRWDDWYIHNNIS
jgi:FkbM family methyltransferase